MSHPFKQGTSIETYLSEHKAGLGGGDGGDGGAGRAPGDKRLVPSDTAGFLNEQVWDGSRWITIDFVRAPSDSGGSGTVGRTQFESERQLDLANAKNALATAQAALKDAQTRRDQLAIQRAQLALQKAQFAFDKAQAAIGNKLAQDTLNASIAATKQRLDEIKLEAELAFKAEDALLTKRLNAEREMLELRLDNDFRELLFSEIGAERRTLIQEQGETRRLAAELQGKDPFRQASLLGGQAQRGRTPAQKFGQQNQAFLNQPLPQANVSAPFGNPRERASALAALQTQLTGVQGRIQQPLAPPGLAGGGTFSMRGPTQSFLVGEGGGVIPGITEVMTIGDGKVTVSPLMGGFQQGGEIALPPRTYADGTLIVVTRPNRRSDAYVVEGGVLRKVDPRDVVTSDGSDILGDVTLTEADFAVLSETMGFGSNLPRSEFNTIFPTDPVPIDVPPPAPPLREPAPAQEPAPEPPSVPPIAQGPAPEEPPGIEAPIPGEPSPGQTFEPPPSGESALGLVDFLSGQGMTRGEVARFLAFALGLEIPEGGGSTFSDVDPNDPFAPFIAAVAAAGIFEGFPDGTFRSGETFTRFDVIESRLGNFTVQSLPSSIAPNAVQTWLASFTDGDPQQPPVVGGPQDQPVVGGPQDQPLPPGSGGPSQQDILAGLQALAPGFAGLSEFVPRTQTGQFGGVNALRDLFQVGQNNFAKDPFSGQFRRLFGDIPEGRTPTVLDNIGALAGQFTGTGGPFGAPVVNQGAFNLQNLATLGFDPALVRLGGQEDIFYRDPTTGELRQFGTPDIFEQSGFNLQDVFNISPTGQNFQFGNPITSPLPLDPNSNTVGPFRMPLIDPLTGALLFDPFQNASSLLQLFQENPSAFNNLLSSFGTAGLNPEGFQSRLDLATPTGRLDNPFRIGFTGTRL